MQSWSWVEQIRKWCDYPIVAHLLKEMNFLDICWYVLYLLPWSYVPQSRTWQIHQHGEYCRTLLAYYRHATLIRNCKALTSLFFNCKKQAPWNSAGPCHSGRRQKCWSCDAKWPKDVFLQTIFTKTTVTNAQKWLCIITLWAITFDKIERVIFFSCVWGVSRKFACLAREGL